MYSAARRAASRRGSSMRIFFPARHDASNSARGTRVVLPAPGEATSTQEEKSSRDLLTAGSSGVVGSVSVNVTMSYNYREKKPGVNLVDENPFLAAKMPTCSE